VSGLGSIDVWTYGSPMPVITTRVFNDLGTAGTLGFNEPVIRPEAAGAYENLIFTTPSDLTAFRMNVGIRSLSQGATIMVRQMSPNGESLTDWATKTYEADYFEQVSLQSFLGGTPAANSVVEVVFAEGSAIVYASTTDNRTNDSSISFLTRSK
jgi:hypothetical protein